jgi:hypothetical protein
MSPAEIEAVYWKALGEHDWHESSAKPFVQKQQQEKAWEAVIRYARQHYEVELERLREENRGLQAIVLDRVERDAR